MMLQFTEAGRRPLRQVNHLLFSAFLGALFLAMTPLANAAEQLFVPGRFFLDVEGQFAGWVLNVDGGQTKIESSDTRVLGQPTTAAKLMTGLEVEDLRFEFGGDMAPIWWKWINESLGANPGRTHDMAVVVTDIEGRQMRRVVLRQARIKEVRFPIADAATKDLANFTVVITAGSSQHEKLEGQAGPPLSKARALHGSAFQFELDGMPTHRVFKVELPVVSIKFTEVRTSRTSTFTTPTVDVGNMTAYVPVRDADAYFDWYRVVPIAKESQETKRSSSLSFLAPDLTEVLMTIHFDQVELVEVSVDQTEANAAKIAMIQVELNVERVRIEMRR